MTSIDGFSRQKIPQGELWLAEGFEPAAIELGLDHRSGWERHIAAGVHAGRGKVAFVETDAGSVMLKQLRRGGVAGPIWRERFPSRRRLMANLTLPALARERGIATPPAVALLLIASGPSLWRGWLAVRTVPGAVDFIDRVRERPPTHDEWAEALGAVRRLHDAGFGHPDLNLGNLMVDAAGDIWVIDLDRCRVRAGGLEPDARITAIRRIERSYHKTCLLNGLDPDSRIDWLELYSGGDRSLDLRWEERRDLDCARLERHRRGWRRQPRL